MPKDDRFGPGTPARRTTLLGEIAWDFRLSWKSLVLTDVAFKLIALAVLTPLVGVLPRVLIAMSGNAVLSDLDIFYFFLGPAGWLCFLLVGTLWLAIVALEQASLLAILSATTANRRLDLFEPLSPGHSGGAQYRLRWSIPLTHCHFGGIISSTPRRRRTMCPWPPERNAGGSYRTGRSSFCPVHCG